MMVQRLNSKIVTTKKEHKCFACVYEVRVYSLYTCETCQTLISEFGDYFYGDEGYEEGCVREYAGGGDGPEQTLKELRDKKHLNQ